jgi:hypothetical protein
VTCPTAAFAAHARTGLPPVHRLDASFSLCTVVGKQFTPSARQRRLIAPRQKLPWLDQPNSNTPMHLLRIEFQKTFNNLA